MARVDIDWEAIERDFRLGRGSVREIAKRFGVGHQSVLRHAAKGGWTQDKAPEIKRRVAERLLLSGPERTKRTTETDQGEDGPKRSTGGITEADIEATVDERVAVLREHQRAGRDLRKTLSSLRRELDEVIEHRDEIADAIEDETRDDKTVDRRNRMLRAVSLPARAQAAAVLTGGFKNAVSIERQAHGLGDGNDAASPDEAPLIIERRIVHS